MKTTSTLFLRFVLGLAALVGLAVAITLFISIRNPVNWDFWPLVVSMYAAAVPFYIALWQAFKLLNYIDHGKAFSNLSLAAFQRIRYCALAVSMCYIVALPFLYRIADQDDAPGVMLLALVAVGAPIVVAVFIAVLERILQSTLSMKSENDLIV